MEVIEEQKKGEQKTSVIRVSTEVKELLSELKIIEQESFDAVIKRLLDSKIEDFISLNESSQKTLNTRILSVRAGKVFGKSDLYNKMEEARARNHKYGV